LPVGLYHPPISSANLLLVGDGQVKLVESWLLPLQLVPADLAHYRAPELSTGQELQPASVVYALGILLFELITGQRPIHGDDAQTTALAHLTQTVPPLVRVRPTVYLPSVDRLIARATARDPNQRFADAQTFVLAMNDLWHELTVPTRKLVIQPVATPHAADAGQGRRPSPAPTVQPSAIASPQKSLRARMERALTTSFDVDQFRRQNWQRGLVGWLIMMLLLLAVAVGSFWVVNLAINRLNLNVPQLELPSWQLPDLSLPGRASTELYVVNISEGLNLRSAPNAQPDNILMVVPNGTVVRRLEGPVVADNIPWLKVQFELNGKVFEGWMSLNYLRQQE
jgi:serine/threonine protein kinase